MKSVDHHIWVFDAGSRKNVCLAAMYKTAIPPKSVVNSIINWIRTTPEGKTNNDPKSLHLVISHSDRDHISFMGGISYACRRVKIIKLYISHFDNTIYIVPSNDTEIVYSLFDQAIIHRHVKNDAFDWNGSEWDIKHNPPPC